MNRRTRSSWEGSASVAGKLDQQGAGRHWSREHYRRAGPCTGPKEGNVRPEGLLGHSSKWVDLIGSSIAACPPECWPPACGHSNTPCGGCPGRRGGWDIRERLKVRSLGTHGVLSLPLGYECPGLPPFIPADTPCFRFPCPQP